MTRSLLLALLLLGAAPETPDEKIDYRRDVVPILSENCYACHGPDAKHRKSGLRLDTREGALKALKSGDTAVVPGHPEKSALVERVSTRDEDDIMPPVKSGKKLTPAQVATLRRWVKEGAPFATHWTYVPVLRPALPAVKNSKWPRRPVDRFILSRLEREGLTPSPEADRITLLRRLSFDLTGLPPDPKAVDAFLADKAPGAFERQVDRLLDSPHYGERMAIFWLDLVRFADTRGYHSDNPRNVSPYRDYVIRAFNENKPFDRFTVEQLAGDLLPNPTLWQRVASGYNKLNQTTEEGGAQPREYEVMTSTDRVRNASVVWMGATMGCCQCHDHKYDPYTMKDFYSFAAFFADIAEAPISDRDPGIPVPTPEDEQRLADLATKIAALRKKMDTPTPELARAQTEWEKTALQDAPWTTLAPASMKSAGGATLKRLEDGSIRVSGKNPGRDTHTIEVKTDLKGITGLKLEALPDKSLKGAGPGRASNGNFVLTRFRVRAGGKDLAISTPKASHQQNGWPIRNTLDRKDGTGWAILPHVGKPHTAIYPFKKPMEGGAFSVVLEYRSPHASHVIGRLRLSATTRDNPVDAASITAELASILKLPADRRGPDQKRKLAAYFRTVAPRLRPLRDALARTEREKSSLEKNLPRCLVSKPGKPRVVRILDRGNWMDTSGPEMQPAIPEFLGTLDTGGRRATRLDLARWLVARNNPLTARTFANRIWKLFFGTGLSKRLDDLGAQGEPPVHPELLDWLAAEFREKGWDVKGLVRLLLTSATYRQSSAGTPALRARDPYNRLHARQSSWRLEAELVRDNALAVSGLLVRTVGGRSVRPYQPAGYWMHLNFPKRKWAPDAGENIYRRGLYTWWQRSFLHPSLMAFDAPSREECTAERPRSNIPQQALVLLNDPTYVEAARVFAARIVKEGGATTRERIAWACRRVLSRPPAGEESALLAELLEKHRNQYRADAAAAARLLAAGRAPAPGNGDAAELAAWTSIARTLLNLHETVTRN